ncbi:MAG: DNA internalization-related competence protein ComEC/Rec2 [Bacilli bacterium]|nr:DNA internalization-related competence protein ComEC/Rec2 [Bacilli bacterium]
MGYLKLFLNKLKTTSVYRELINNVFLLAFFFLLLAISINHFFVVIFLGLYGFYVWKKSKTFFILMLTLGIIFIGHIYFLEINYSVETDGNIEGIVTDVTKEDDYYKIIIKSKNSKKIIYDYKYTDVKPGYYIMASGKNLPLTEQRIENGFDYASYLKHNNIDQIIQSESIDIKYKKLSLFLLKYYLYEYLEKFPLEVKTFIKGIVLGDDDFSDEFTDSLKINGIMHLFAVSGLHIGLLVVILQKILENFEIKKEKTDEIISVVLLLYLIITMFTPSIVRAALLYYFKIVNQKLKLGFKSLDVLSFVFILLLLISPYYIYSIGFILSFLMAFTILLISPLIKKKSGIIQILIISTLAQIITFPIIINLNNKINLVSPFVNVIYILAFSIIILPLTLLVLFFPIASSLFKYMIIAFEKITIFISDKMSFVLVFPNLKFYQLFIFYFLIILLVISFKYKKIRKMVMIVFLVFLTLIYYQPNFHWKGEINFLDLANGEAIFIQDSFLECTALIDTGEGKSDEVTKFLLSKGIRKMDYLILTHNHSDHNGEAEEIIENINVDKVIVSYFDNSRFSQMDNTKKVYPGDEITCGKIKFQILNPYYQHDDENDNSLVIYSKIGNLSYLFLGDVSKEIEVKIAQLNLEVDVIKIAHHGSLTSTDPIIIDKTRPEYAIILTGRATKFGFPHKETIATLNMYGVITYRTDINYSVKCYYNKKETFFTSLK